MALRYYTVTLSGSVQRLVDTIGVAAGHAQDAMVSNMIMQPGGANAGTIYVGGDSDLSTSEYLFSIPAAIDGIPPAPFVLDLTSKITRPSHWYVRGSLNDVLHFGFVE